MTRRPSDSRANRIGMTLETARVQPYGSCDSHTRYSSKRMARRSARRHVEAFRAGRLRCLKCARGMTPHPFRCTIGRQTHHHWGHMWRNSAVEPSEDD